ncbi:MAG: hypothetical protein ACOVP8_13690, partial [Phycisphaerales bacterium]
MTEARAWRVALPLGLALLTGGVSAAWAQPEDGPPSRRDAGPQAAMRALLNEQDPERAKQALDAMLEEARVLERDLSAARERLNKGDDVRAVLRDLGERRMAAREGIRERAMDRMGELRDGQRGPGGPELGGRRGGERFMKPGGFAKLSQEERDQLREDFKRDMPEVAADLEQLRATNGEMADMLFSRIGPRYFEAREARRVDPALADLRIAEIRGTVDVLRKTRAYRDAVKLAADDANRTTAIATATTNLREAIARNFDERLAVQKHEAEMLAKRLEELRADIANKGERKDALVDDALDRMVRGLPPQMQDDGPRGR